MSGVEVIVQRSEVRCDRWAGDRRQRPVVCGRDRLRGPGAAFLPFSAGIATGATVARKLVPRLGVRVVPVIGLALATAGMIVLTQLPVHGRYASNLLPGVLPIGLGLVLTFVPITLAGTSEVSGEDAGHESGLLNTAQQVVGSIGLAILSTLAASRTTSLLHGPVTPWLGSCSPSIRLPRRVDRRRRTPRRGLDRRGTAAEKPPGPRERTCGLAIRSRRSSGRMRAVRTGGGHQRKRTPDQQIRQ